MDKHWIEPMLLKSHERGAGGGTEWRTLRAPNPHGYVDSELGVQTDTTRNERHTEPVSGLVNQHRTGIISHRMLMDMLGFGGSGGRGI